MENPEVDMTPMIDCVFQLITFFMLVINFESTSADERVKLPESEIAKPPKVKREDEVTINLGFIRTKTGVKRNPDGSTDNVEPLVFLNGEDIPIGAMTPRIKKDLQLYKLQHPGEGIKTVVKIRADSETPIGAVQDLIKLYQEQKYEKFALQAMEAEVD
jgi:biopolymer transport protein ExbD